MVNNKSGPKKRKRPINSSKNNKINPYEPQDEGFISDCSTISSEHDYEDDIIHPPATKKQKLSHAPPANNILDLINIGKSNFLYNNIDNNMLNSIIPYLEELNNMIGLESLKKSIFYQIIYYLQNMHLRNKNEEYLHTVITGPAGCGKTTVAKIIGNIYKNMGILSRKGKFTAAYRQDFVGEYVGHTAPKTQNLLESCLGGVLFIDEVYALGSGEKNKDSFSKEAIDTLNAFLSDHKNDFCCIIAGYENEIKKCFFSVNSGLERRFPWIHRIGEYSSENLVDMTFKMILKTKWEFNIQRSKFIKLFDDNKDLFKNSGGDIETFITKCKMVHSKRVFSLDNEQKFILTEEDLENATKMLKDNKLEIIKKEEDNFSRTMMYI